MMDPEAPSNKVDFESPAGEEGEGSPPAQYSPFTAAGESTQEGAKPPSLDEYHSFFVSGDLTLGRSRIRRKPTELKLGVPHIYQDYSAVPDSVGHVRKKTGGVTQPFPEKLMELLTKETDRQHVVGWLPHGRAFIVRKPKIFTGEIMPKYFRQSKLTSFLRQLNLYGFRRITKGTDAGAYYHELFLRGRPQLCLRIHRQEIKGTGHRQPADKQSDPNFYNMPPQFRWPQLAQAPQDTSAVSLAERESVPGKVSDASEETLDKTMLSKRLRSNRLFAALRAQRSEDQKAARKIDTQPSGIGNKAVVGRRGRKSSDEPSSVAKKQPRYKFDESNMAFDRILMQRVTQAVNHQNVHGVPPPPPPHPLLLRRQLMQPGIVGRDEEVSVCTQPAFEAMDNPIQRWRDDIVGSSKLRFHSAKRDSRETDATRALTHDDGSSFELLVGQETAIIGTDISSDRPKASLLADHPDFRDDSRFSWSSIRERRSNVYQTILTEALDDISDLAYRAASARLRIVDSKTAVRFLQKFLGDYYNKARKAVNEVIKEGTQEKMQDLISLRKTIVGLWCGYARLVLDIADLVRAQSDQLADLKSGLIDFSLMLLSQACCCPLAGNHAWIALSYSKIAQLAFGNLPLGYAIHSEKRGQKSLLAATKMCRHALGVLEEADPYFDQQIIDHLVRLDFLDMSTTLSLFRKMGNTLLGDKAIFKDEASESLLRKELRVLDTLQEKLETAAIPSFIDEDSFQAASILLNLPVPTQGDIRFLSDIPTTSELSELDGRCDESESFRSIGDSAAGKCLEKRNSSESLPGVYCMDVELVIDHETSKLVPSRSYEVEQLHLDKQVEKAITSQFASRLRLNKRSKRPETKSLDDVTFYCPRCGWEKAFRSKRLLDAHLADSDCYRRHVDREPCRILRFGESRLKGDWKFDSFDPENGPLLSQGEILDVLEYSVELFETKQGVSQKAYSMKAPYFIGQVGLRCQYCYDKGGDYHIPGSVVYPECATLLSLEMRYLSINHLDGCLNQPSKVRRWHQEYRKLTRGSRIQSEKYWRLVADGLGLESVKYGGVFVDESGSFAANNNQSTTAKNEIRFDD